MLETLVLWPIWGTLMNDLDKNILKEFLYVLRDESDEGVIEEVSTAKKLEDALIWKLSSLGFIMGTSVNSEELEKWFSKEGEKIDQAYNKQAKNLFNFLGNNNFTLYRSDDYKPYKDLWNKIKSFFVYSNQINKWNPADILLVQNGFTNSILKDINSVEDANAFFRDSIRTKTGIIPVSLKKPTLKSGKPQKINFQTREARKAETDYYDLQLRFVFPIAKTFTGSIEIQIMENGKPLGKPQKIETRVSKVSARSKGLINKIDFEIAKVFDPKLGKYKSAARQGKIGSKQISSFRRDLKLSDKIPKVFLNDFISVDRSNKVILTRSGKAARKRAQRIFRIIISNLNDIVYVRDRSYFSNMFATEITFLENIKELAKKEKLDNKEIKSINGRVSSFMQTMYVYWVFASLYKRDAKKISKAMDDTYNVASSRSDLSSPHIKLEGKKLLVPKNVLFS